MIRLLVYTNAPVVLAWLHAMLAQTKDIQLISSESIDEDYADGLLEPPHRNQRADIDARAHVDQNHGRCKRRGIREAWIQAISIEMAHALREAGVSGILRKDALLI
jgi:hypothetical protein